jgi:transposase
MGRLLNVAMCSGCKAKMSEIYQLKRKVERQAKHIAALQKKLNATPRTINEKPFGPSTSSSRVAIKPGSAEENRQRTGGGTEGHTGHGRKPCANPDVTELIAVPCQCLNCGGTVQADGGVRERTIQDIIPQRTVNRRILIETGSCIVCGKTVEVTVPGVFARAKYSNGLLATVACQHYVGGRTQGDVCAAAHIGMGAFNHAMHALAERLMPCMTPLRELFLLDPVRFADETSWREDGANRYTWLLSTLSVSLFLVGRSRATVVPMELFEALVREARTAAGVLVVDRYAVYARLPVALQYCYAHLKRDVEQLEVQFPDHDEVKRFCRVLVRLLARAMGLRKRKISDRRYYQAAELLRQRIVAVCAAEARHPGIQGIQDIFRQNQHRLYHWVCDRRVPPENNYSERGLRPLVIARKLSFGSQSPRGSKTREVIMSVLHSLAKQGHDPATRLTEALDALARDQKLDIAKFLFPPRPPPLPLREAAPLPNLSADPVPLSA